jgi:alkyl hydroperoxide reductase subunit AhpC
MKNIGIVALSAIILTLLPASVLLAQAGAENPDDSAAIKKAALDYIEGYYTGDATRMERAIHPDINKASPRDLPQTGKTILTYATYSFLVESTRAKAGLLDEKERNINVQILNIDSDVANVKITSNKFIDYLQIIKLDGQWKIVNVMWTSGTGVPQRLTDFNPETERPLIEQSSLNYLAGITGADAAKMESSISPEFNRIAINPFAQTGKIGLRRQRYSTILESVSASIGKQDENYRNNLVSILDIADGLAIVKLESVAMIEYTQLYKSSGKWLIFNSIVKPKTNLTLAQAMTAIIGHPMPDFTLPVYGGGEFALSKYRGKNVLLVFPRGWTGFGWCTYCPYQYLELEQLEKAFHIKEKYNLEIAFVMPYSSDRIKDWIEKFPDIQQSLEGIKNPQQKSAAGSVQADYTEWAKKNFPLVFDVKKDDPHNIIPVLVDENRTLSRNLKIFTGFWDGISAEQNMAAVFIIDKQGILKFKYISQMTEDRPSVEFLLDVIQNLK